jgi:hypothetical protein
MTQTKNEIVLLDMLLEDYGLKVVKTRNCTRNVGKQPVLVLFELFDVWYRKISITRD